MMMGRYQNPKFTFGGGGGSMFGGGPSIYSQLAGLGPQGAAAQPVQQPAPNMPPVTPQAAMSMVGQAPMPMRGTLYRQLGLPSQPGAGRGFGRPPVQTYAGGPQAPSSVPYGQYPSLESIWASPDPQYAGGPVQAAMMSGDYPGGPVQRPPRPYVTWAEAMAHGVRPPLG